MPLRLLTRCGASEGIYGLNQIYFMSAEIGKDTYYAYPYKDMTNCPPYVSAIENFMARLSGNSWFVNFSSANVSILDTS